MLNRLWQWTSAPPSAAVNSTVPVGPLRFRPWTSANQTATNAIPHGPLRFRAWTSGDAVVSNATIIPHGPFRFRPWTSGPEVEPQPPQIIVGGVPFPFPLPRDMAGRIKRDDEEIMLAILAWLHATNRTIQ